MWEDLGSREKSPLPVGEAGTQTPIPSALLGRLQEVSEPDWVRPRI